MMTSFNRFFSKPAASCLLILAALAGVALGQGNDSGNNETGDDPVVLQAGDYQERRSDLEARFEIAIRGLAASQGLELNQEIRSQLEAFKPSYLEQRATEVALLQEAERRGITVSDDEVDALVEDVRGNLAEGEEFDDVLVQAGFRDEAQLRELVRETEFIQRAVDSVESEIEVSEAEVEEYYQANPESFEQPEEVCARHILVESVAEAEQTLADLEAGGDFATLADERSIDPGGRGGDLGCFERGRMVPPFEEAAFAAEVGEPVGPVESQFGQHVILVYERTEAEPVALAEVQPQIEQQLQRERLGQAVEAVRQDADIEVFPERLGVPLDSAPEAAPGATPETAPEPVPEPAPETAPETAPGDDDAR
ncbi:MAG: peptidylprolyl isomerase [Trueperaceae bacterium]